ncbi:MAG: hypothetical protein ACFFC7_18005 [Candidatus Hermodarchaeota archaeon]
MVENPDPHKGLIHQIMRRIRYREEEISEDITERKKWFSIFFCKEHKQIYVFKGKIERRLYLLEGFFNCGCTDLIFALSCDEAEYRQLVKNNEIKNVVEKAIDMEKKTPYLRRYPHKPLDELLRSLEEG